MLRIIIFDALLVSTCAYALWRGGSPERIVAGSFILAYVATLFSYSSVAGRFYGVEQGVFATDVALLALLMAVAIRADRGWPLVVAALQLDTVGAHILKALDPGIIRVTYALLIAIWSYPMLLVVGIGTFRHQARLRRNGYDINWSRRPRQQCLFLAQRTLVSDASGAHGSKSGSSGGYTPRVSSAGDIPESRRDR